MGTFIKTDNVSVFRIFKYTDYYSFHQLFRRNTAKNSPTAVSEESEPAYAPRSVSPSAAAQPGRPPPTIVNRPGTAFRKIIRHSAPDRPSPLGGFRTIASRIPLRSRPLGGNRRTKRKRSGQPAAQRRPQARNAAAGKSSERKETDKTRAADTAASGYDGSETTRIKRHEKAPHGG